jgi:hypothetical protein
MDADLCLSVTSSPFVRTMLKRIRVEDLTLGMYLQEFCGSWMDHPFWRTKFVLTDPKTWSAFVRQRWRKSGSTSRAARTSP